MEAARNIVFVGGLGSGKSNLATAIGVSAIREGKCVRFWGVVDLVNQVEARKCSPPTKRPEVMSGSAGLSRSRRGWRC